MVRVELSAISKDHIVTFNSWRLGCEQKNWSLSLRDGWRRLMRTCCDLGRARMPEEIYFESEGKLEVRLGLRFVSFHVNAKHHQFTIAFRICSTSNERSDRVLCQNDKLTHHIVRYSPTTPFVCFLCCQEVLRATCRFSVGPIWISTQDRLVSWVRIHIVITKSDTWNGMDSIPLDSPILCYPLNFGSTNSILK